MAFTADGRESTKQRRVKILNSDDARITRLPENYLANTNKEELCLEYVRNFNGRFKTLHPKKDSLFLIAANEYGVEKFVPTSVRPTLLPFKEVYDMNEAAAFVANYLHYEPLEVATEPPSCLPSSSQILEWGCGDCFDLAMLLTSFLLGAGYDAFVVMGKAPRCVTLRDQSMLECPLLVEERRAATDAAAQAKASHDAAEAKKPSMYLMPPKPSTESAFEAAEAKAHDSKHKHKHHHHHHHHRGDAKHSEPLPVAQWLTEFGDDKEQEAKLENARNPSTDTNDPLLNKRTHCWVLVRGGKRGLEGFRYIEPSTGVVYDTANAPYLRVDSMWNAKNYFVNLQDHRDVSTAAVPVAETSFDTLDMTLWQFVFLDPARQLADKEAAREMAEEIMSSHEPSSPMSATQHHRQPSPPGSPKSLASQGSGGGRSLPGQSVGAGGGGDTGDGLIQADDADNMLDLPPSWVGALRVDRLSLSLKYPPTGSRTNVYFKCKLELFAENLHPQGCVQRMTSYKDAAQTTVVECRELFKNRRDKLSERVRYPLEAKTSETFLPGRPGSLKAMTEWAGRRREIDYYSIARTDGLRRREEDLDKKIIDLFENRGDAMVYRSATVHEEPSGTGSGVVTLPSGGISGGDTDLVVHKMAVKYALPAAAPAAAADAGKKTTVVAKRSFYLREGRVRTQYHVLPGRITPNEETHFKEKGVAATTADGGAGEALRAERECLSDVKRSHTEMLDLLKQRRLEEVEVVVDEPIFDAAPKVWMREKLGLDGAGGGRGGKDGGEGGGGAGSEDEEDLETREKNSGPAVDYLTPFLPPSATGKHKSSSSSDKNNNQLMSRAEAQVVRDACLKSLKERLLERANIIQNRLNDENAKLAKRQATFQRNASHADPAAEEEFERFCADAMFTIGILEQRLVSHEETALKKYQALDERLSADPRLVSLLASA